MNRATDRSQRRGSRNQHAGRRNRGKRNADAPAVAWGRDKLRQFTPSAAQIRYKRQLVTALRNGQSVTDTAICRKLCMSRQTVWEWRQDADFRGWLRIELDENQSASLRYAINASLRVGDSRQYSQSPCPHQAEGVGSLLNSRNLCSGRYFDARMVRWTQNLSQLSRASSFTKRSGANQWWSLPSAIDALDRFAKWKSTTALCCGASPPEPKK